MGTFFICAVALCLTLIVGRSTVFFIAVKYDISIKTLYYFVYIALLFMIFYAILGGAIG